MSDVGWIQTYTGRKFYPCGRPEGGVSEADIDVRDIAHALALQCRFAGHVKCHYSVAQHCLCVSANCPRWPLHGLLHDAAEAYLTDLPRPLKQWLRSAGCHLFDRAEDRLMTAISRRFGLAWTDNILAEVDAADKLLLATEARDLMSPLHPEWHIQEINGYPVMPETIVPMPPDLAERAFLRIFHQLTERGDVNTPRDPGAR